jgi:DNA-binding transcriptional LysR family regulator
MFTGERPIASKKQNLSRLDLNLIVVLEALLMDGSVTRAASRLHVTQSAVSHALRKLRAFFDDPLFTKTPDGVVPTPKALELAAPIAEIMSTVRGSLLSEAAFDPRTAQRTFGFALNDIGELAVLPILVERLRSHAPACTINTIQALPNPIGPLLESGAADLFIGVAPSGSRDILKQYLYDHTSVVIASKRAKIKGDLGLDQYCRMQHVLTTAWGSQKQYVDIALEALGLTRPVYLTTPYSLIVPLLVEQEPELLATVPRMLADVFAKKHQLRIFDVPFEVPTLRIHQYWHRRYDHDPAHTWLRSFVRETLYQHAKLHVTSVRRA